MKNLALMGAIALTGAVGFTACSSSNDVAEDINPNYNPETNAVKTEFVINVTQPGERTRMAAANAGAGAFQGLNDMYLLCFPDAPGTSTAIATGHELSLAGYPSATLNGTQTDNSSKWYTLYIPTATRNFLFYAKTVSGAPSTPATTGKLNYTVSSQTSVGSIGFSLQPIIASAMTTDEATLLSYLNTIVAAKDATDATLTWESSVAKRDGTDADAPDYKDLADAYQKFISTSNDGVRQGSARAILSTIADLYVIVNNVSNTKTGNPKKIADAVITAINNNFTIDATTGAASFNGTSLPATTTQYPQNLPDGSAILTFNTSSSAFAYTNGGSIGTATIATAMANFTYPSELTYYCNSALRATSSIVTTSTLPTNSVDWLKDSEWTSTTWSQTSVDASTRAVAMKENVTYGAAQLYSTISSNVSTFTDNAYSVTHGDNITGNDIENQSIDLSGASDYLKVTGIIIGGQPTAAGYDYLPTSAATDTYAIYDNVDATGSSAGTVIVGKGTSPSTATYYTLALDNYTSATTQSTVNVAVEFVASKDFFGKDGLIKAGQSFYLIGSLNPSGSTIDWTKHVSFKSTDNAYNKNRVFIRDAKTTATFTLNANSLQNAYSTIPDLRSTQMVFGLSVDLAWKPGLTFNVNF